MQLFDAAHPNPAGYRDVSPAELPRPPVGFRLIDVREPWEYSGPLGHIAGSELLPMNAVLAQALSWNRAEPVVLVCRSGGRSASVAQGLLRAGFDKVMNLVGGMMAWNEAGLPVEK